jgi:hypothetical protein
MNSHLKKLFKKTALVVLWTLLIGGTIVFPILYILGRYGSRFM